MIGRSACGSAMIVAAPVTARVLVAEFQLAALPAASHVGALSIHESLVSPVSELPARLSMIPEPAAFSDNTYAPEAAVSASRLPSVNVVLSVVVTVAPPAPRAMGHPSRVSD